MARRTQRSIGQAEPGLGGRLTPRGRAVVRALDDARTHATTFILACGVLPEVSESASEHLHSIVRSIAERRLGGRRPLRQLRRQLATTTQVEDFDRHVHEALGAEATAAYLFGLAVGLAIQDLPVRLRGQ